MTKEEYRIARPTLPKEIQIIFDAHFAPKKGWFGKLRKEIISRGAINVRQKMNIKKLQSGDYHYRGIR